MDTRKVLPNTKNLEPTVLNIGDAPPALDGNIRQMTPEEFILETHNGMTQWTETIEYPYDYEPTQSSKSIKKKEFKEILNSINKFKDSFAICDMGEVGYGLFTLKDIPANQWIMFYSGSFRPIKNYEEAFLAHGPYAMATSSFNSVGDLGGAINAQFVGGMSRYIQHGPDLVAESNDPFRFDLNQYEFISTEIKNKVGFANADTLSLNFNGFDFLAIKTTAPISQYQPVLINYSKRYWIEAKKVPALITKEGGKLPDDCYSIREYSIKLYVAPDHSNIAFMHKTKADWDKLFSKNHNLTFYTDVETQQTFIFEKEQVERAMEGHYKNAPFLILDKPVAITSFEAINQFGLFACRNDKTTLICTELYWATNVHGWKYNATKDVAFLTHEKRDVIQKIAEILNQAGLRTQTGKTTEGKPLIYVHAPNVELLKTVALDATRLEK